MPLLLKIVKGNLSKRQSVIAFGSVQLCLLYSCDNFLMSTCLCIPLAFSTHQIIGHIFLLSFPLVEAGMHLARGQNIANKPSLVQVCSYNDAATEPQQQDLEEALKSRGEGLWADRQEIA